MGNTRGVLVWTTVAMTLGCTHIVFEDPDVQLSGADESNEEFVGSEESDASGGPIPETKLDVDSSQQPDTAPTTLGCNKVDFLFVIDSSNSMATNQDALIDSFPEFVDSIRGDLDEVESYHIGVVTSDAYVFNGDDCNEVGHLVTKTGGIDSSGRNCTPFSEGSRYMTSSDDLYAKFACTARVGTAGDNDEQMMNAALRAISPLNGYTGACNEGFIREDALLVMVLITDEDDPGTCSTGNFQCSGSPGAPGLWYEDVIAVKGYVENTVVLALTRGTPGNSCTLAEGSERDGERIMAFADYFGSNGLLGDICASSFGPFFDRAVDVIKRACFDFQPPVG